MHEETFLRHAAGSRRDNRWILFPRSGGPRRVRLFCVPHAGSGAALYCRWWRVIPDDIEVCPIKLPGRDGRLKEAPFRRLTVLAETIARETVPFTDIPFAIFGHSMGALIGFEVARALRREGCPAPLGLFASGYRAPQLPTDSPLHDLPEPELLEGLRRRYGSMPETVSQSPELLALFLPVLRADMEKCETYGYRREEPFECPMRAFGGLRDVHVSREHLAAWREQTRGPFELTMFPGGHFFLQDAQTEILDIIASDLALWLNGNSESGAAE